jgi:hypothetical protein
MQHWRNMSNRSRYLGLCVLLLELLHGNGISAMVDLRDSPPFFAPFYPDPSPSMEPKIAIHRGAETGQTWRSSEMTDRLSTHARTALPPPTSTAVYLLTRTKPISPTTTFIEYYLFDRLGKICRPF